MKKVRKRRIYHSEERGMTRKTVELLIAIITFATEVLAIIRKKINGRKGNDEQRDPKKR